MSTTAPAQLDPTSLDLSGISVATTVASDPNPRTGTIYDPVTLAAAAPLWFHPMPGGGYLMVNARAWTAATPSGGLGLFTDYAEVLDPSWFVLSGPTGQRGFVPGYGPDVPINTAVTERRVTAAASRAPDYLYLLSSVVIAGQPAAHLQHLRVAPSGVRIYNEEVLPTVTLGPDIVMAFDKGVQYQPPYLYLYGTDSTGQVYRMRKRWAEIGTSAQQISGYTPAWEVYTGTGYSYSFDQVTPLTGITSVGPMSFGDFRQIALMSVVTKVGSDYSATIWESRRGRPFRPTPTVVALGSEGSSYLGHGLVLQPQLEPNPAMLPNTVSAAVPYLVSLKATVSTGPPDKRGDALVNTWGLHTIRL